jgi:predicted lipoprotein with Yx(FWY)xxD motif
MVTVAVRSLPGVGTVLVNSRGYTLYVFAPDNHRAVTCTGTCAGTWPPLMLPSGSRLGAGAGVKPALLGSDRDPAGGRVVTYDGWPLYGYAGDVQPGLATGQDMNLNGGEWYVIRPSGSPLIPAP